MPRCFVGTLTSITATGNQQSAQAIPFLPKAILFFFTHQSATGFATGWHFGIGMATTAAQEGHVTFCSGDNAASSISGRGNRNDSSIQINTAKATQDALADFVSFDTLIPGQDYRFTVNWSDAPSAAWKIGYLALGGDDLTNAKVHQFTRATVGATQAVTGVGFQPDALILITNNDDVVNRFQGQAIFNVGFATGSSTNQAAAAVVDGDGLATKSNAQWQEQGSLILDPSAGATPGEDGESNLASMDSDGFTLNHPNLGAGSICFALCLKGGRYETAVDTKPTSVTTKKKTTSFEPSGIFRFSVNAVNRTTINNAPTNSHLSVGAAAAAMGGTVSQAAYWGGARDAGTANSQCDVRWSETAFHMCVNDATLEDEATTTFQTDGITDNWTTSTAVAKEWCGLVFGQTVGQNEITHPTRQPLA